MIKHIPKLGLFWGALGAAVMFFESQKSGLPLTTIAIVVSPFFLTVAAYVISITKGKAFLSASVFTACACSVILLALENKVGLSASSTESNQLLYSIYIIIGCLFIVGNQKNKYKK